MAKRILYGDDARQQIFGGISIIKDSVCLTLGPKGRNVLIENTFGSPTSTNDGVTVTRSIDLEDKAMNIGASMMKESAEKTNKEAGDGTTSTVLLTYAICKEGLRYIKSGINPFALGRGLHEVIDMVVGELKKLSKKVNNKEEIKRVATISSQDDEVGQIITDIMEEIGNDGTITVEDGNSIGLTKEIKTGMQLDNGYISQYFVTNKERMEAVVDNPLILVIDKKIIAAKDLLKIIDEANKQHRGVVIIAEDVDGEALSFMVFNKLKGVLNICAIKGPGLGDKKEVLKDVAIVTGAKYISGELGLRLEDITLDMLGTADRIISTKDNTIIIGGGGSQIEIDNRVGELKKEKETAKNDYEKQKLERRIAKLSGGIAVIQVGASTEMEMLNKKYKIEDAILSVKSAIEEGIVAGGGSILLQILPKLVAKKGVENIIAFDIIKGAIEYPAIQIANNAGYKGDRVVEQIKSNGLGFDAKDGTFKDLLEAGIIDPTKVIRISLENAVSTAIIFLTTESIILDDKKEKDV